MGTSLVSGTLKKKQRADLKLAKALSQQEMGELLELKGFINQIIERRLRGEEKQIKVPLGIFGTGLNPGEALVKYLRDNRGMRLNEISQAISRNSNSLWLNYHRAIAKHPKPFGAKIVSGTDIPLSCFSVSGLSYLEAIVFYLRKSEGRRNKEISKSLGTSDQVVSMAYARAISKVKNG